jgi:replicative DNA helicase
MFRTKTSKKEQIVQYNTVVIRLNLTMLNMLIGIIFNNKSTQVTKKSLLNVQRLINRREGSVYDHNEELASRFRFIKRALEAKLDKGFENEDAIINYCRTDTEDKTVNELIRNLPYLTRLSSEEIKYTNKTVEDRLKHSYLFKYKDKIYSIFERMDSGDYESYHDIVEEAIPVVFNLLQDIKKSTNIDKSNSLSFDDDNILELLEDIARKFMDPSRIIKSGLQMLNKILAPGFHNKRLYTFFGLPGTFKSGILMSVAYWAKLFNAGIKTKRGKRPTILYITLENDIDETIERLFNMAVVPTDIRDYTPKEVAKMFKEKSRLFITNENDITIQMQYFGNREIDTWDIGVMIEELLDEGKEVVMLIVDYLKRVRPYEVAKDEKQELKNVSNELKNLAVEFDIPVISAQQLNREGQKVIDNAKINNKDDLTNLLGRGNISTAC